MGHWPIDALSWDRHKSAAAFDSSPNGIERSLVQHPLQPCLVQVPLVNGTLADRCSVMGQAQDSSCIRLMLSVPWERHSQLHLTHATVVSPCHPRWCGQRLAELPAHWLPGSRRSGSITMLMWPGVSLPCAARWLRGIYHPLCLSHCSHHNSNNTF